MNLPDTIDHRITPFYQWDDSPYLVQSAESDGGVAVSDSFCFYFLPDSTMAEEPVMRTSLFTEHGFSVRHERLENRTDTAAPVWLFVVLMALTALITLYYHSSKLRFKNMAQLLFDSRAMDRTLRNNNLNKSFRFVPMGFLVVAGLMLPVHQLAMEKTGVGGYLLLTVAVTSLYMLRNGLMRLLARVFDNSAAVDSYITSNYLYHLALATLLLPLVFLQTYLPYGNGVVLYIILALVMIEVMLRLVRGLKLFLTQSSGPYVYLFYYLCIIELIPFLVLVKWIIE